MTKHLHSECITCTTQKRHITKEKLKIKIGKRFQQTLHQKQKEIFKHMDIYVCACIHVCMFMYVYILLCVYLHTHTYK